MAQRKRRRAYTPRIPFYLPLDGRQYPDLVPCGSGMVLPGHPHKLVNTPRRSWDRRLPSPFSPFSSEAPPHILNLLRHAEKHLRNGRRRSMELTIPWLPPELPPHHTIVVSRRPCQKILEEGEQRSISAACVSWLEMLAGIPANIIYCHILTRFPPGGAARQHCRTITTVHVLYLSVSG